MGLLRLYCTEREAFISAFGEFYHLPCLLFQMMMGRSAKGEVITSEMELLTRAAARRMAFAFLIQTTFRGVQALLSAAWSLSSLAK